MQTRTVQLTVCLWLFGACTGNALPESIWPPADFELVVEERSFGDEDRGVRQFRAWADGTVSFATADAAVTDAETGTALPLFDRVAVYRLVPTSIRALARRVHGCGILELDTVQGERNVQDGPRVTLTWRAFGRERVITARGRVHGAMADVLAIVAAHLPEGERFELQQASGRPVVPVLRGVPAPRRDPAGALRAHLDLLADRPAAQHLLLDAFALACALPRRSVAEELLARWLEIDAAVRRQQQMFPELEPGTSAEALERLLPSAP